MFLKVANYKNGKSFLSIVESYRDDAGVNRQRVVKKLGYLHDLKNSYDDPIAHFKDVAKQMTDDSRNDASVTIEIDMNSKLDNSYNLLNVGYLPYKYLYNELGLNDFLIVRQRSLNIEFSLTKNLQLLVFSGIMFPSSKISAFENRHRFFGPFDKGITKDSVYDSLDYFCLYKKEIQKLMWEKSKEKYQRDCSKSYYDCTNYYFEIDYNDDDIVDDDGNIIEKGMRKRGPEKNHRPDPIVEMGLL